MPMLGMLQIFYLKYLLNNFINSYSFLEVVSECYLYNIMKNNVEN
jgi:hypothetical protein